MTGARTRRGNDERGITLVEVLVASVLTLVVLVMGYGILTTTTKSVNAVTVRASNTDNARLALDSLEANLRYADGAWATTCASGSQKPAVGCRTLLTVQNAPGSTDTHQPACAQWVATTHGLTERSSRLGLTTVASTVTGGSFAIITAVDHTTLAHHLVQVTLQVGSQPNAITVDDLVTPDNASIAVRSKPSSVPCR